MNKVILMGRLTRDAEIRYTQGENSTAIARFSLAVDRRFKRDGDEQTADFISCVAFGKVAEFLERFGRKGTKFALEMPYPDRQLYKQRWTACIYYRCCCREHGIC